MVRAGGRHRITVPRRSVADGAVDALADQVGVPVVPGVLLDHVQIDPAQADVALAGAPGRTSRPGEWPSTAARASPTSWPERRDVGLRACRRRRRRSRHRAARRCSRGRRRARGRSRAGTRSARPPPCAGPGRAGTGRRARRCGGPVPPRSGRRTSTAASGGGSRATPSSIGRSPATSGGSSRVIFGAIHVMSLSCPPGRRKCRPPCTRRRTPERGHHSNEHPKTATDVTSPRRVESYAGPKRTARPRRPAVSPIAHDPHRGGPARVHMRIGSLIAHHLAHHRRHRGRPARLLQRDDRQLHQGEHDRGDDPGRPCSTTSA